MTARPKLWQWTSLTPIERRQRAFWLLIVVCLLGAAVEAELQREDSAYVRVVAERAVREAGATTDRERVIALRDYLRSHVTHIGAPTDRDGRPFLRATASETLQSGLGWCGEISRVFINMAWAVGIPAQRANLYGRTMHTVAEVRFDPHQAPLVVDGMNPPLVPDLEPIDQTMLRPEYDDYYTVNLRRAHLGGIISRVRLEIGPLSWIVENPHAIKALMWLFLAVGIGALGAARAALRRWLARRGWVHVSTLSDAARRGLGETAPTAPSASIAARLRPPSEGQRSTNVTPS